MWRRSGRKALKSDVAAIAEEMKMIGTVFESKSTCAAAQLPSFFKV